MKIATLFIYSMEPSPPFSIRVDKAILDIPFASTAQLVKLVTLSEHGRSLTRTAFWDPASGSFYSTITKEMPGTMQQKDVFIKLRENPHSGRGFSRNSINVSDDYFVMT